MRYVSVEVVLLSTTGESRFVSIPEKEVDSIPYLQNSEDYKDALCERAFVWGQNDFQPQQMPSVSVGDVVVLVDRKADGTVRRSYHRVAPVGFDELNEDEFSAYSLLDPLERVRAAYNFGEKG